MKPHDVLHLIFWAGAGIAAWGGLVFSIVALWAGSRSPRAGEWLIQRGMMFFLVVALSLVAAGWWL